MSGLSLSKTCQEDRASFSMYRLGFADWQRTCMSGEAGTNRRQENSWVCLGMKVCTLVPLSTS